MVIQTLRCSSKLYLDKVQIMISNSLKFLFFFSVYQNLDLFYVSKMKALPRSPYIILIYVEINGNILWATFNFSGVEDNREEIYPLLLTLLYSFTCIRSII